MVGQDQLEYLLKRDRLVVATCLFAATLIAAYYIFTGAGMGMSALEMTHPMPNMGGAMAQGWTADRALMMFLMWWVMMIAMMLPAAAPTILLSAALNRRSQADLPPFGNAAVFTLGYLLAWAAFSLVAVVAQWLLERAGLLSMHMESASSVLTGGLLIAAGAWQLSPMKNACLNYCRSPVEFLTRYRKPGTVGALRMGLHHGLYCLGCCWFLMALLFAGGVMNLYWIIGLAAFVYAEKVLAVGRRLGLAAGPLLLAWGTLVLLWPRLHGL